MIRFIVLAASVATTTTQALDYDTLADAFAKAKTAPSENALGQFAVQVFPGSCFSYWDKTAKQGTLLFAHGKKGALVALKQVTPSTKLLDAMSGKKATEKAATLLTELEKDFLAAQPAYGFHGKPAVSKDKSSLDYTAFPPEGRSKAMGITTHVAMKSVTATFHDGDHPVLLVQTQPSNAAQASEYCLFFATAVVALGE